MEKCTIKTCVKKETQKGVFFTIELSDGRKGISSDDLTGKIGVETDLEVKEGKPYNDVMQYYFNLPKQSGAGGGGKFPPKDWTFSKKQVALECAVQAIAKTDKQFSSENIIALAEKFFEYLNKK